jgi:hypothetical protein
MQDPDTFLGHYMQRTAQLLHTRVRTLLFRLLTKARDTRLRYLPRDAQ